MTRPSGGREPLGRGRGSGSFADQGAPSSRRLPFAILYLLQTMASIPRTGWVAEEDSAGPPHVSGIPGNREPHLVQGSSRDGGQAAGDPAGGRGCGGRMWLLPGGSTANLSLACEIAGRELIVYDSFEGLPSPDPGDKYGNPYTRASSRRISSGSGERPRGSARSTAAPSSRDSSRTHVPRHDRPVVLGLPRRGSPGQPP